MPIFDSAIFDPVIFDAEVNPYIAVDMAFQTAGYHRVPMEVSAAAHHLYPAAGLDRAALESAGAVRNSFAADGTPRISFLAHMEGR